MSTEPNLPPKQLALNAGADSVLEPALLHLAGLSKPVALPLLISSPAIPKLAVFVVPGGISFYSWANPSMKSSCLCKVMQLQKCLGSRWQNGVVIGTT